jgi:uncharacterized OsmC-like protein
MTPPELMLAAPACCGMRYVTEYLRARNLALEDVELPISVTKGGLLVRLVEIGIEVAAPGLSIRAREGLVKAIEAYLLHRTLADPPKLNVSLATLVSEGWPAAQPADLAS